ncbi:MAG: AGE family epimerase/isomerase [Candidatus Sphingomonas phytovorans]|nr:AGE family epimerase/isomerase [Sphingomonas sp.]WEK02651.1 MAG: AGE family epimerase/isomerase [Sphingomonas sp.]
MQDYVDWIVGQALPFWAGSAFDRKNNRFVERLDLAGHPLAVPHRAMVQARQIYVFAHAAELGWSSDAGSLAERAAASLRRDFFEIAGGKASLAFSINPASGLVHDATRDSYAHAFVLLGLAQLYRINGDRVLLILAAQITAFVEDDMTDARHGGLIDDLPRKSSTKRQNPQMHLLEAYLAWAEVAPDHGYLERAGNLIALFMDRMMDHERQVLIENFADNWTPHPDPERASVFEPGHHYEWVWLLWRHQQLSGSDHRAVRRLLMASAMHHGHGADGIIYDEVSATKRVLANSSRLWPHTEAIKAAVSWHAEGDPQALEFARSMANVLLTHFVGRPFPGGWVDRLDHNRDQAVDHVPASSLYHLFLGAAEAHKLHLQSETVNA